jgi:HK97 family phage major capsid protein
MEKITSVRESRTYSKDAPHSYYRDRILTGLQLHGHEEARARLAQHGTEVRGEIADGNSKEGRRALRQIRRQYTTEDEFRTGMTTTSAVQFVTPEYFNELYGAWLQYPPTFTKAAVQVPDEGYGVTMNIPSFATGATVAQHTENTAVSNSSPTDVMLSSTMVEQAGEVDVSQQLWDRTPKGFDQFVHAQLLQNFWQVVDTYIITQALVGVTAITSATYATSKLWAGLNDAAAQMETTSGTAMQPSHLFMTPNMYRYLCAQVDSSGRPLLLPNPLPPFDTADEKLTQMGYTGERILDFPVYRDGNIPVVSGTQTQMLVANMTDIFVCVTEPTFRSTLGANALGGNLTIACSLYALTGVIIRHAGSLQTLGGAAYPASPNFGVLL